MKIFGKILNEIKWVLAEYGILLKPILVLIWVLWAVQLYIPIKGVYQEEVKYQQNRDIETERRMEREFQVISNEMIAKAEKERSSYSPKRYFEDLKKLDEAGLGRVPFSFSAANQLQQISLDNVKKGYYKWSDVEKEAGVFRMQNEEKISHRDEFNQAVKNIGPQGVVKSIISWLLVLYKRSIFVVFFFYLTRMAERMGILETILADKKRLVLAMLLWPIYFFKYPYNVIREIRVEAELRRLKGLFRVFSFREARLVREVANSSYYKHWLAKFHQRNRGSFQRGLFVALIVTLFIHLLIPSTLRALEKRAKSPVLVFCQVKNQIEIDQNLTDDTTEDNHQVEQWGLPLDPRIPEPPLLSMIVEFLKEICHSRQPDSIDRVPRTSLFGFVFKIINQTRKGIKDEYGQDNNLRLGDFNGFVRNRFCRQSSGLNLQLPFFASRVLQVCL